MPEDDEIVLRRLTSVQTSVIRGEEAHVVLEVKSGDEAWYFVIHVKDLAALGRRMVQDAQLLQPVDLVTRIDQVGGY